MVLVCFDWPQTHRPEPNKNLWGIVQEKMKNKRTKKMQWAEGHGQRNLGFYTTSAVPQTDHLHAPPNEAVIKAKGAPTMY